MPEKTCSYQLNQLNLTSALDKADNAKDAAKAMNRFADGLEDIWPKMKEISKKYPELKDKDNPPEELKESQKKAGELAKKWRLIYEAHAYMQDPEVQKAQKRLSAEMTQK